MNAEKAKLKRLQRLERLRAITRQTALGEAAKAEAALAQVTALGTRTANLIAAYGARRDAADAAALQHMRSFIAGLARIGETTATDLVRARAHADARAAEAAAAERQRAAVEDRITATAQTIARKAAESAASPAAKAPGPVGEPVGEPVGTPLE